ncbi:MAG: hypothetical protein IJ862_02850 [Selenomonadaceae bacterium]|nr:hypothetical protein [Selenomonadaceae bacterium]
MKLFIGKKVGVSKEEKALPYFKFYEQDMAKIPEEKLKVLESPAKIEIVPFEQRDLFLKGADTEYCKVGYGTAANGVGFSCNETLL